MVVPGATISVFNSATGAERSGVSGGDGSAVFAALPLNGQYKVSVTKHGFNADDCGAIAAVR